jgi:hypothetical protein
MSSRKEIVAPLGVSIAKDGISMRLSTSKIEAILENESFGHSALQIVGVP